MGRILDTRLNCIDTSVYNYVGLTIVLSLIASLSLKLFPNALDITIAVSGLSWEYPLSWIDLTLKSLILLTDEQE